MNKALPFLALCASCSPTAQDDGTSLSGYSETFVTQRDAPAPDYDALLKEAAISGEPYMTFEARALLPANAKAIGQAWVQRLKERDALLGYGLAGKQNDSPVDLIDVGLTRSEFDQWAVENGWEMPAHIRWSFVPGLNLPAVSEAAEDGIRFWPASTARTGVQLEALLGGKVELRDGCFYVGNMTGPADKLAWFHAEVGLDVDEDGYFIFTNRVDGQTLARIGEQLSWGGPPSAKIGKEAERQLREQCGDADIEIVGTPQSTARMMAQNPHMGELRPPPQPR